jgi:hypothetical protein
MTAIASRHKCILLHVESETVDLLHMRNLRFLTEVSAKTNCPLHHVTSTSLGLTELANIIEILKQVACDGRRSMLLVSGCYLEDRVTVCVLEAIAEGFDVHLLCDFILARDPLLAPVLQHRLFQAGAVPSSLRQFLYLWQTAELDGKQADVLCDLQKAYETNFARRPA